MAEAVLIHELAHVRRRDLWTLWLERAVLVLFGWSPLLWWLRSGLAEDRELACDAWVAQRAPDARREYALALVERGAVSGPGAFCASVVSSGGRRLRRRILAMFRDSPRPHTSVAGWASAGLILLLAGGATRGSFGGLQQRTMISGPAALARELNSRDPSGRRRVIDATGNLGAGGAFARPVLLERLEHEASPSVRREIRDVLQRIDAER